MTDKHVYADCAASAPMLPQVIAILAEAYDMGWGNPNSVHKAGRIARQKLEEARETVAHCIGAKPSEIYFTPSATAACRYAIDRFHIDYCSPYEHKAVREYVSRCDRNFITSPYAFMLANNETGEIYARQIKELSAEYDIFTDATAAVGQIPVNVEELGVKALAAGGHKFGAPVGIGFLYARDEVAVNKDFSFPGTPPAALAVALAEALEYRTDCMESSVRTMAHRRTMLIEKLTRIPGAHINCINKLRLPNIGSVRFDGINARELLTMLDANGVFASAGAACTADADTPSPTLLASGLNEEQALSTIRLSFCPEHTDDDYDFVAEAVSRCVGQLCKLTK